MLNLIIATTRYGDAPIQKAHIAAAGIVKSHIEKISQINPILPSPPALNTATIPVISTPENGQIAKQFNMHFEVDKNECLAVLNNLNNLIQIMENEIRG